MNSIPSNFAWAGAIALVASLLLTMPAGAAETAAPSTTIPQPTTVRPALERWNQQCAERVAVLKGKPCDAIFIGDSLTQNFQESPTENWRLVGRPVWDRYYGRRQVLNFGVGGDGIQNALWRMENMDIRGFRPRVAVILLGMNNAGESPEDIATGVQTVVTRARDFFPGVKVIVVSITANGRMPEKTPLINALLARLADGRDVFYLDLYSRMTPTDGGWKGVGHDKVHLTEDGYELWASEMEPLLRRLLDR